MHAETQTLLPHLSRLEGEALFRCLFHLEQRGQKSTIETRLNEALSSPIGALERGIYYLLFQLESLKHNNLDDLQKTYHQRVEDLHKFISEDLEKNPLEFPAEQIIQLKNKSKTLKAKLNEIGFYLQNIKESPIVIAELLRLRAMMPLNNVPTAMKRGQSILNAYLPKIKNELLAILLNKAFSTKICFFCYTDAEIEKSIECMIRYFSKISMQLSYPHFIAYLRKHGISFFPLSKSDVAQLCEHQKIRVLASGLRHLQKKLQQVNASLMQVQHELQQLKRSVQVSPVLRTRCSLSAILKAHHAHWQFRSIYAQQLDVLKKALQENHEQITVICTQVQSHLTLDYLRQHWTSLGLSKKRIAISLKKRQQLLTTILRQHKRLLHLKKYCQFIETALR